MHLPDGTIGNQASLTFLILSGGFLFLAASRLKQELFEKARNLAPALATDLGAFSAPKIYAKLRLKGGSRSAFFNAVKVFCIIYAVQYFDFPIINGVYGHLIGAALAGIVLGPALGILTMSAELVLQAMLGDGGILALGANIFDMAVIGSAGGYYLHNMFKKYLPSWASIMTAVFISVVASAMAFGLIMFVSHQVVLTQLIDEIIAPHLIVGLAEAALTLMFIKLFFQRRLI